MLSVWMRARAEGTYHERVELREEGTLVRSLDLESSVLTLDVSDILCHQLQSIISLESKGAGRRD
jgi:hypothetical protein